LVRNATFLDLTPLVPSVIDPEFLQQATGTIANGNLVKLATDVHCHSQLTRHHILQKAKRRESPDVMSILEATA